MLKHCAKESDWSMDKKYGQRVWTKELSLLWIAAMDLSVLLCLVRLARFGEVVEVETEARRWRSVRLILKMEEWPVRI